MKSEQYHFNRIFCVGRNYINHAKELNNQVPKNPVIFLKPTSCIVNPETRTIKKVVGNFEVHFEAELVLLVGKAGYFKEGNNADEFIHAFTLGLDLTLRQLQNQLKAKGLPWEKSKAFDNSSPLGLMIPVKKITEIEDFEFSCYVNNEKRQHGKVSDMIFSFEEILKEISTYWQLLPGDLIYTGTPEGVGILQSGDTIRIESQQTGSFEWKLE